MDEELTIEKLRKAYDLLQKDEKLIRIKSIGGFCIMTSTPKHKSFFKRG